MNDTEIGTYLCVVVGVLDIATCIVVVVAAQAITRDASWFDGTERRWSAIRRVAYWGLGVCMITHGVLLLNRIHDMDWRDAATDAYIDGFLMFFPVLRAFKVISQDKLLLNGNGVSKMLSDVASGDGGGKNEIQNDGA